jgi:pimeloyl-ACP methyl ester carboxylesterase
VELGDGIKIAYDLHEPPTKPDSGLQGLRENAPPILFLHGLFGSKKNNRGMSKYARFAQYGR